MSQWKMCQWHFSIAKSILHDSQYSNIFLLSPSMSFFYRYHNMCFGNGPFYESTKSHSVLNIRGQPYTESKRGPMIFEDNKDSFPFVRIVDMVSVIALAWIVSYFECCLSFWSRTTGLLCWVWMMNSSPGIMGGACQIWIRPVCHLRSHNHIKYDICLSWCDHWLYWDASHT